MPVGWGGGSRARGRGEVPAPAGRRNVCSAASHSPAGKGGGPCGGYAVALERTLPGPSLRSFSCCARMHSLRSSQHTRALEITK